MVVSSSISTLQTGQPASQVPFEIQTIQSARLCQTNQETTSFYSFVIGISPALCKQSSCNLLFSLCIVLKKLTRARPTLLSALFSFLHTFPTMSEGDGCCATACAGCSCDGCGLFLRWVMACFTLGLTEVCRGDEACECC